MKIIRQYSRAVNSKDLQDDELHISTLALTAVALTSKLGASLFRMKYCGDMASIKSAHPLWRMIVARRAKSGWETISDNVADIALLYWIDNTCPECSGRGHPIIIDTPTLAAATCQLCNGTGQKKLVCDDAIRHKVEDMVQVLESIIRNAARKAQNKMG